MGVLWPITRNYLTSLCHLTGSAFLSLKKRYTENRSTCVNAVIEAWYGSRMRLLIGSCSKICLVLSRNDEEKGIISFVLFHCCYTLFSFFFFLVFCLFVFVLFCLFVCLLLLVDSVARIARCANQPQRVEHVLSSACARNAKDVMTISVSLLIGW